ncbi:hypothetical protein DFH09DRAFT_558944 [Mycena vulgaris]|nr:hypothetical protein DFH09DRAFT_558944 [Mycena vulgaris]
MDPPRLRGTFLTFVGFIFASIGFTLSVLSTFVRFLLPRHPTPIRSADVTSKTRQRTIRRTSETKHKHRNAPSTTNSSISNVESTVSSEESCGSLRPSTSEINASQRRTLKPASAHNRVESEYIERPDFRNTVDHRRRRSESTPPSPSPWAFSHSAHPDPVNGSTRPSVDQTTTDGESDTVSLHPVPPHHLPRAPSFEGLPALNARSRTGLSFLRRKVRKAPSAPNGLSAAAHQSSPLPPVPPLPMERKASQLFGPLLHRRKSQPLHAAEGKSGNRRSQIPAPIPSSPEEDAVSFSEGRPSRDSWHGHLAPRRSQTLRTQPYDAPYFFPAPGSVAAESYLPPRRNPVRSRTLHPDELEGTSQIAGLGTARARPHSGSFPNET